MAYVTSYPTLVADLKRHCENNAPEFVAEIPAIIARAQDQVQRDLDLDIWQRTIQHHTAAGVRETVIPTQSILKVSSIFLPMLGRFVDRGSFDKCRLYAHPGVPKVYAEVAPDRIAFGPMPAQNYACDIRIIEKQPALTPANPTNWFTEHAASLLLYQSLIGCESFLVSPERVAGYAALYGQALSGWMSRNADTERTDYAPVRATPKTVMRVKGG